MKTVKGSTVTKGRLEQSINHAVNRVAGPQITQQITDAVENERVKTGVITKFYQFLDRAEVQIDDSEELILCKILHRFGGELIDFYTPTGDEDYCDNLKETCIIPREDLHVLILNIADNSDEWLMLGYYYPDELIGVNPAAQGNIKIVTRGGSNQFWIKFGYDGLDLRLPDPSTINVGEMDSSMEEVDYADSTNVYTKEEVYNKTEVYSKEEAYNKTEVYTKEEVDELIAQAINEALGEDSDDTTT